MSLFGPKLVVPCQPLVLERANMPQASMLDREESVAARLAYEGLKNTDHTIYELPSGELRMEGIKSLRNPSVVRPPFWPVILNNEAGVVFVSAGRATRKGRLEPDVTLDYEDSSLKQGLDFDGLIVIQRLAKGVGYAATLALVPAMIEEFDVFRFGAY